LINDIASDHFFVQADGRDKITHAPNATVEIHLTDEFEFLFEDLTGFGFQSLDDGGNGKVWWYFNLQMNVVVVGVKGGYEKRGIFLRGLVEILS